ncbi:MAG: hypothetical protein V2B19_10955 [Pseudomonadota bacterium]
MGDLASPANNNPASPAVHDGCVETPRSGQTCIKAIYPAAAVRRIRQNRFGGVYFQFPEENWGQYKGYDLSAYGVRGETVRLIFAARGARGGEVVSFKAGGINRFPDSNKKYPYQDSFGPITPANSYSQGALSLTTDWQEYRMDLTRAAIDNVIGGFCWVANDDLNPQGATFYLDDIRVEFGASGTQKRLSEPRFIRSLEPKTAGKPDMYFRNACYIYDQALALLAFLSTGGSDDLFRAKLLADAFVSVQNNDRFFSDGRLRNAYACGDLLGASTGKARLPGWYDDKQKKWCEDKYCNSSDCGNMAWTVIALLSYWEKKDPQPASNYLRSAERMAEWIHHHNFSQTGPGGYTGGVYGWEPSAENREEPAKVGWKSTEHNIDIYVAFMRLARATGRQEWIDRAEHAKMFVRKMWDPAEGHFWAGTDPDGHTVNKKPVPLDVHSWAILAFKDVEEFSEGVRWAMRNCKVSTGSGGTGVSGFDFKWMPPGSEVDKGIWWEGTAQMQLAMKMAGFDQEAANCLQNIRNHGFSARSGEGVFATDPQELSTGFPKEEWGPNMMWKYYRRSHVGATCWCLFAELGWNPYWSEAVVSVKGN